MRFASLVLVLAVGCGGVGGSTDVDPTLSFADATDVEISRLVAAATASEGFSAQAQLYQFDDPFGDRTDPCPAVVEDAGANTVTITGGCTTIDDEMLIEGSAVIRNPQGWGELEYDFNAGSVHEFHGFALTFAGGVNRMAWDGSMYSTLGFSELDLDLTTDSFGVIVRSDLYMECRGGAECEHGASGLELVGKGGVLVSGKITVSGQNVGGRMTLRGIDTVEVTITQGCTAWRLVGTDRSFDCQLP